MNPTGSKIGHTKRRSGWLIPIAVFIVTAALSTVVLGYYLFPVRPLLSEQPAPTDATVPVALTVGGKGFHIPANFIPFSSARKGGAMTSVELMALLPDLQGYTLGAAQEFAAGEADSRVVNITIHEDKTAMPAEEQLERLYLPLVEDRSGTPALYDLTSYRFRPNSGYPDQDLFVGDSARQVILRCGRETPEASFPNCDGEMALGGSLWLSYRFKRSQLEHWREIDSNLRALSGALMDKN